MSPLATSGTAPLSSPPLQTHAITKNDSKGEKVLLIVGSDALPNGVRTIKTSIPRIARLSPRWVEAFNRGSKGRSYGVVKIRFPEDDAEAFNIIVMAAHDRFNALPQTLTLKGLVQLGRVAERYDLNHLLVGHIRAWLAPHRERVTQRGYEQWLYVAWQFGLENDFIALVNHLATRCKVDEEGRLLIPDTDQPLACQLPHGALDAITQKRLDRVRTLFNLVQIFGEEMMIMNTCGLTAAPKVERDLCTSHNSVGYHRYLRHYGLLPRPLDASKIRESVQHTLRILTDPAARQFIRGGAVADKSSSVSQLARPAILRRHNETCCIEKGLFRVIDDSFNFAPNDLETELIAQIKRNAEHMGHEWRRQNMASPSPAWVVDTGVGPEAEVEDQEEDDTF